LLKIANRSGKRFTTASVHFGDVGLNRRKFVLNYVNSKHEFHHCPILCQRLWPRQDAEDLMQKIDKRQAEMKSMIDSNHLKERET